MTHGRLRHTASSKYVPALATRSSASKRALLHVRSGVLCRGHTGACTCCTVPWRHGDGWWTERPNNQAGCNSIEAQA
jgi:hypothetical protein